MIVTLGTGVGLGVSGTLRSGAVLSDAVGSALTGVIEWSWMHKGEYCSKKAAAAALESTDFECCQTTGKGPQGR